MLDTVNEVSELVLQNKEERESKEED